MRAVTVTFPWMSSAGESSERFASIFGRGRSLSRAGSTLEYLDSTA